ncbi:hypothetical protein [Pedobacter sp. GR22-6]|uniref:hypothetical protein n=1 Tax=Pedobacter sp. GR22-6 TaxID=3127957 RepID=UPI00307FA33D
MRIFPVHFKTGSLDLDAIVTSSEAADRFKVEMVTGEPNPIILKRSEDGSWLVENPGGRRLSPECYQNIGTAISEHLKNTA